MVYIVVAALGVLLAIIGPMHEFCAEIPTPSVKNWAVPEGQLINSPGPSLEEGRRDTDEVVIE